MEEKKKIEIISDNGSTLNISPVYEHLNVGTPKSSDDKPKNVVIPKNVKNEDSEKKDSEKEEEKK